MQHRIGIVSEWKLPAFTSKSLISKSTFYSSCQQIFALQTKHLKWKVPLKIWFSHSDQTWGRRYSIVSYKAVSWHEGRWSLLYGRYLETVQARHTQFHFCSYKHTLLSSNVFIPPLPLATQDFSLRSSAIIAWHSQMSAFCLLNSSCQSKTGDKGCSIKSIILYICFSETREQDIIFPGHLPLPTASAGILKQGKLSIAKYFHLLIPQWNAVTWTPHSVGCNG